ncbi:MAG: hypothetical protein ACREIP_12305, partial [Alphaproteobacteria bacterium]
MQWKKDRDAFLAANQQTASRARQRFALQLFCNIDLDCLDRADEEGKAHLCRRLKRLIERERLKGARGHWSYDLNRHIGLKQVLDSLQESMLPAARADGAG